MSGLADVTLPDGVELTRTTPVFTAETVPAGLLGAHRVAPGVWGLLRVFQGEVTFVVEASGDARRLTTGDTQVIEPDVAHHIEPGPDAELVVEFYR